MRLLTALFLVAGVGSLFSCSSYTTRETEVGVLVCKWSLGCEKKGVQDAIYPPGSTNIFAPFIRDFYTFDTKAQNLEMVRKAEDNDDLEFKTVDGNDIQVDVTVVWALDAKKTPEILQTIGESTEEVREKLVRPVARTLVRDVLNELDSESIYNADKRFEKAEAARVKVASELAPYGILVSQVILHEHRFNPEYEKVIHDRKLAEQQAQRLKSETDAAAQEALRNLEATKGKVATEIAAAQGQLERVKLEADAKYFEQEQTAEAILAERKANAKAIGKRNEALRGAGGRAMVKLKIAETLAGKSIVMIPSGESGLGVNRLDVNRLIDSVAAQEVTVTTDDAPKTAEVKR